MATMLEPILPVKMMHPIIQVTFRHVTLNQRPLVSEVYTSHHRVTQGCISEKKFFSAAKNMTLSARVET